MDEPGDNTAEIFAAKKALRERALVLRAGAARRHGTGAAAALAAHGLGFAAPAPGATVSAFWAIGDEIDPMPLLDRLRSEGHAIALPVMAGKDKPLVFRLWQPGDPMATRSWGIREPVPEAAAAIPDIVLTALLAFDRSGYRLGYGGGYYDRTLAALRETRPVIAIGLAYAEQEVACVPHLPHDQRLDWILTPEGPHRSV